MTQPTLFPVADPLSMGKGGHPAKVERERLTANALRVLERLKQGPATNAQLVAVGGIRAVGRVFELKRDGWHIQKEHVSGGTWRYRLIGLK